MGISIRWDEPEHPEYLIQVIEFVSPWTWQEYEAIHTQSQELARATEKPVHAILDFQRAGIIASSALSRFAEIERRQGITEKIGEIVVVTNRAYLLQLVGIYNKVFTKRRRKFVGVASIEAARAYIDGEWVSKARD